MVDSGDADEDYPKAGHNTQTINSMRFMSASLCPRFHGPRLPGFSRCCIEPLTLVT